MDSNHELAEQEIARGLVEPEVEGQLAHFKRAYDLEQNTRTNFLVVQSLIRQNQITEAVELMTEQPDYYTDGFQMVNIAIKLNLQVNMFLSARKYLIDAVNKGTISEVQIKLFEREIDSSETKFVNELQLENKIKIFQSVLGVDTASSYAERQKILKQLNFLPLVILEELAGYIFMSPVMNSLIKAHVLNELGELAVTNKFEYLFFGKKIEVIPKLAYEAAHQKLHNLMDILEESDEIDTSLIEGISAILNVQTTALMANVNNVIKDNESWIKTLLGTTNESSKTAQNDFKWQKIIENEQNKLI